MGASKMVSFTGGERRVILIIVKAFHKGILFIGREQCPETKEQHYNRTGSIEKKGSGAKNIPCPKALRKAKMPIAPPTAGITQVRVRSSPDFPQRRTKQETRKARYLRRQNQTTRHFPAEGLTAIS